MCVLCKINYFLYNYTTAFPREWTQERDATRTYHRFCLGKAHNWN